MASPSNPVRQAFTRRPWVRGTVFDLLRSPSVLHCDAYLTYALGQYFLTLDWSEGGRASLARDVYLIDTDAHTLTPVWDQPDGLPLLWTMHTPWAGAVHHAVVARAAEVLRGPLNANGRWSRVSLQAHYVHATDADHEPAPNHYKPYNGGKPRAGTRAPVESAPKRPRGRPRKAVGTLPDLL